MRFLLDTDIISNLLRPVPSPALLRRVALTPKQDLGTSSITLGELYFGAYRYSSRTDQLMTRIESTLANTSIASFDAASALRYGELRADLQRAGALIGDADTRIAAIALANDLTMVTANVRHFERVAGLAVENWLV